MKVDIDRKEMKGRENAWFYYQQVEVMTESRKRWKLCMHPYGHEVRKNKMTYIF